jgi:hypothetical protein
MKNGFDDVGEFQLFYADSNTSEEPVMVELEEGEFVGSVGVNGHKSWL